MTERDYFHDDIVEDIVRWFWNGADRAIGVENGEERRTQGNEQGEDLWGDYSSGQLTIDEVKQKLSTLNEDDYLTGHWAKQIFFWNYHHPDDLI